MKVLIGALILLVSTFSFSQEQEERKTPEIISKIGLGETMTLTDEITQVTFLKVITDSRCPKGVTCVWAGEVEFEIEIKSGNTSEVKRMKLTGGLTPLIKEMTNLNCYALTVSPYPENGVTVDPNAYVLEMISKAKEEKTSEK
ncbi:MAG: hypothetical protein HRT68_03490 [Flavobacteriaceae bacterium]|nr:hypothetical protein [Flavobacteriaceae bacterium]